jgi:hypothetical protein
MQRRLYQRRHLIQVLHMKILIASFPTVVLQRQLKLQSSNFLFIVRRHLVQISYQRFLQRRPLLKYFFKKRFPAKGFWKIDCGVFLTCSKATFCTNFLPAVFTETTIIKVFLFSKDLSLKCY